ncbi:MAG: tetratricopeptide repeat protein, partial [Desulfosudaceae bacterium]
ERFVREFFNHIYLSGTAAARGDFKKAVQLLLRCLEAEERQTGEGVDFSGRVRKYYRQGLAAEKDGRDKKAAECYRRALTIGGLDLSAKGLRRQMAGDYDQWSAERRPQGVVIEDCHPAQD